MFLACQAPEVLLAPNKEGHSALLSASGPNYRRKEDRNNEGDRWHLCLKGEASPEVPKRLPLISHGPVGDPAVRDTVQSGTSHGPLAFGREIIVLLGRKKGEVAGKQMTGGRCLQPPGAVCSAPASGRVTILRGALLAITQPTFHSFSTLVHSTHEPRER